MPPIRPARNTRLSPASACICTGLVQPVTATDKSHCQWTPGPAPERCARQSRADTIHQRIRRDETPVITARGLCVPSLCRISATKMVPAAIGKMPVNSPGRSVRPQCTNRHCRHIHPRPPADDRINLCQIADLVARHQEQLIPMMQPESGTRPRHARGSGQGQNGSRSRQAGRWPDTTAVIITCLPALRLIRACHMACNRAASRTAADEGWSWAGRCLRQRGQYQSGKRWHSHTRLARLGAAKQRAPHT